MMNEKVFTRNSLLVTTACLLVASFGYNVAKDYTTADGTITITTPSVRIQIETLKPEWGKLVKEMENSQMFLDAKSRNLYEEGGIDSEADDISVQSDSTAVVFKPTVNVVKFKKNDIRIDSMTPEVQKWISIRVQELSFMLSDLFSELQDRNRPDGVILAGHVLFLNSYTDLYHISRAQLPNLRWLDDKLYSYDEHISTSLKYVNAWIAHAEQSLTAIEQRDPNKFSTNQQWLSLVWALKRLKKEQSASRDINQKIDESVQKLVKFTSRGDWLKAAIIAQKKPEEIIYYREGIEKITSKSFPLEAQYSRYHNKL